VDAMRRPVGASLLLGLVLACAPLRAAGRPEPHVPGFVDGSKLAELAGDDAVSVEITLGSALLKPLLRADPELRELAGGIESIYAVVLEIEKPEVADEITQRIRDIERRLVDGGWQRVARVKDHGEEVKVLVLTEDEETFGGLVVMVIGRGDDDDNATQIVFANIAGKIDLAAIERISERFDVPGFGDLDLEELEHAGRPEKQETQEKKP
jgi:hypothetical protein